MAESENGITEMRRRMERGQRRPPPARRSAGTANAARPGADPVEVADVGEGDTITAPLPAAPAPTRAPARRGAPAGVALAPDAPSANLAIRVRRPLDERLVELIYALRRTGVRTSKVELIEMLLWELPAEDPAAVTARLAAFRRVAPRGPGAPLAG